MRYLIVRIIYALLIRPWLKYIIGVRFEGLENLKKANQVIIVANHNSHFDTVSIIAALPWNKLKTTHAVAAGDYFGKSSWSAMLTKFFFNAILIKRKKKEGEKSAIGQLDTYLKKGESLVLFPEGSRGRAGVISEFKNGIAVLLQRNPQIPFIPVYLDGFGRVLPKDKYLIIPLVCKVRFGEPILAGDKNVEDNLQKVREAILELRNKDERDRNQFDFE